MTGLASIPISPRRTRHEHTVVRFSGDLALIERLRRVGAGRHDTVDLTEAVMARLGTPAPHCTFHRGRGPHTGYCMPPRRVAVDRFSEDGVAEWERRSGRGWPSGGMIRFGDPTSLGTIAHEIGHHLVHVADPASTPSHGRRWVERFDEAAAVIARITGI